MAVRTTRVPRRLGVQSNSPSSCIQARRPFGRANSQQIHEARLAAENNFRRFEGVARQSERRSEIVSPANGDDAQDDFRPKRRIRERLKRSVPTHRQEQLLSLQNGILRGRFEFSRAVRHHKLCVNPERFE